MKHFKAWKNKFSSIWLSNSYCSHKMKSVWNLYDILIIFWDNNISKRQLLLPRLNISMTNQAYFLPKWVLTPQKETSSHIFKRAIFSKKFGDLISHIIRLYAGKVIIKNNFWMFHYQKFGLYFCLFYGIQSFESTLNCLDFSSSKFFHSPQNVHLKALLYFQLFFWKNWYCALYRFTSGWTSSFEFSFVTWWIRRKI